MSVKYIRRLEQLKQYTPKEFSRKLRTLRELDRYKATEFRLLLLYRKKLYMKEYYLQIYDFLNLSIAITILLSKSLISDWLSEAKSRLQRFVRRSTSGELYGSGFMVYSAHSLLHMADDAKTYRSLNNCSAFPFENYLSSVKRLVRNGKALPKQIIIVRIE